MPIDCSFAVANESIEVSRGDHVELQGGVPNLEAVREVRFGAAQNIRGVRVGGNDQVRR
jgi:hypothetical protein